MAERANEWLRAIAGGPADPTVWRLAALTAVGALVFIASWLISGALEPGYSHVDQTVSELAARDAAHPWIARLGVVAWAASWLTLALAVRRALPRGWKSTIVTILFAVAAALVVATAALPLDCGTTVDRACEARFESGDLSWPHYGHVYAAIGVRVALELTPFAIALALWPGLLARLALLAGAYGLIAAAISIVALSSDGGSEGLNQRLGIATAVAWAVIVASGALLATAGRARSSKSA